MLKQIRLIIPLVLCGLLGAMIWNNAHYISHQPSFQSPDIEAFDSKSPQTQFMLERLSKALQTQTISSQNPAHTSQAEFNTLHKQLKTDFPLIFKHLMVQRLGNSLLLSWPGQHQELKPVLFAAHLDVVPVENPESWEHPPFSGKITKEHIWGRGAIDDKGSALALLEAVNQLIQEGYTPQQTLFFAFGADEEVGGQQGAAKIAQELIQEGIQLSGVIDEGLLIVPGSMIGLMPRVALIGIAEKGYLSLELKATEAGGHSSMPQRETSVDILAQALVKLNKNPLPAHLSGPTAELFAWLGPEMKGLKKLALANLKFFEPLLLQQLEQAPATNALIRTTIAPTMLSASTKENVLAPEARASKGHTGGAA